MLNNLVTSLPASPRLRSAAALALRSTFPNCANCWISLNPRCPPSEPPSESSFIPDCAGSNKYKMNHFWQSDGTGSVGLLHENVFSFLLVKLHFLSQYLVTELKWACLDTKALTDTRESLPASALFLVFYSQVEKVRVWMFSPRTTRGQG